MKRLKTEDTFFNKVRDDPDITKVDVRLGKTKDCKDLPKSIIMERVRKYRLPKLIYRTEQVDKLFYSTIEVDGKKYANSYL